MASSIQIARGGRRRARWVLGIGALCFAAALLEAALQAGSYVVWQRNRQPVPVVGGRSALCVGDSWTFGMGSSDPLSRSYPARVQALLRTGGLADAAVVNGGQSGQNSRDVLERLPSQLAQFQPRVVCVLVGQNDYWSQPERLADGGQPPVDHSAYRFRWRLPRLFAWAMGGLRGAGIEPKAEPRDPAAWAKRAVPPAENPYRGEAVRWTWSPEIQAEKEAGYAARARNDWPATLARFTKAATLSPDDPQARQSLAQAYRELGQLDQAARELDWLRATRAAGGGYLVTESLAWALADAGRWQENRELLTDALTRYPESATLWRLRGEAEFQLGDADAALRSLERSLAIGFDRWTWFTRYKVHFVTRGDLDAALQAVFGCYAVDNDAEATGNWLLAIAEGRPEHLARAAEVAKSFGEDAAVRGRLATIVADLGRRQAVAAPESVLAQHLERTVVAIRNAGAQPLLLTYPWPAPASAVLRRVAREHDVRLVDLEAEFPSRIVGVDVATLRASDGHCNDAGYEIMAAIVADAVRAQLP